MALLITFAYVVAAVVAASILLRRMDGVVLGVFVFSIICALDAQDWMIFWFSGNPAAWPARNITEIFMAARGGLDGPATVGQLAVVAGGRLFVVLGVFYLAFFFINYGAAWRARLSALPPSTRALMALWGGGFVLAILLDVFLPDLFPFSMIARVLAAVAAFLLAANALMVEVKKKTS